MQRKKGAAEPKTAGLAAWYVAWRAAIILSICASLVFLFGCATLGLIWDTYDPLNFHSVSPEVVRSAQPRVGDLDRIVADHGIKSVINLRGPRPGQDWYEQEVADSARLGLARVDIGMGAGRLPHQEDLRAFIVALGELPKPILIHCAAGADRTGEAVATYWLLRGKSQREASRALHLMYGHIADKWPAKTYFILKVWQGEEWAMEVYDPCAPDQLYRYYDRERYCGEMAVRSYEPEGDT